MNLVLASGSPRRIALLRECGIECAVVTASIDEAARAGESPEQTADRLCRAKARMAAATAGIGVCWILAADTVVADGRQVLGKPKTARQAEAFLQQLRGRIHRVITAVCLLRHPEGIETAETVVTEVRMRDYSYAEIRAYVDRGNGMDKAGAYAIQDAAFRPAERIDGCYTNVVGLPMCLVYRLLEAEGWAPVRPLGEGCRTGERCDFLPGE